MKYLNYKSLKRSYNRLAYYVGNFTRYVMPKELNRLIFFHSIRHISEDAQKAATDRIDYYVRLPKEATIKEGSGVIVSGYKFPFFKKRKASAYFFDLYKYVSLFDSKLRFCYLFGDIVNEADEPAFVKTRPITDKPTNSVICKLDQFRHFFFIDDKIEFRAKRDMLIFRNIAPENTARLRFVEKYFNHPMCDIGRTNYWDPSHPEYDKPFVSMYDQLKFKFICCIEGNDVATNLKWVMSSNSLAVMPQPKIESWFMEGQLIGGYHYVEIRDDYSDLIEKLNYYIEHPEEAEAIIKHAHEHVNRFRDSRMEDYISYCVVKKYLDMINNLV